METDSFHSILAAVVERETDRSGELETRLDDMESLDFVDLMLQVENAFGIKIPDQSYAHINTVRDLLGAVEAEASRLSA
jgi:acyl carrier protein